MNGKERVRNKILALLMVVIITLIPPFFTVDAYEPDGGIYNPGKSKDILINIDDEILAGQTEEEFINKLKAELSNLGADISKINITLLRTELDATNTIDWYVYDHTNGTSQGASWVPPTSSTWWTNQNKPWEGPSAAPVNTNRAFYTNYYDSYANSNNTTSGDFVAMYGLPSSGRFNATIKSVIDTYGLNGLRLVWGLREHIYTYSTPVPGKDGKYANMIFAGYGTGDFTDYMYYPITENSVGSIEFDINSAYVNDHSLRGAGFLINTGLSGANQKGYMLYFDFRDQSGAGEGANKVAIVKLYKLKDNVTPETLQSNTGNSKIVNLFTQVGDAFANFPASSKSHWRIVFSGGKITVTANDEGSEQKKEKSWEGLSDTGFYGFGPLVNYTSVGHTCARGTVFQFTNVLMATKYTDELLNLKDASFDTGTEVERYFVNLTNSIIDESSYANPDIYWDTVNRLKSDEVFYLTNEENSILTDGGIKDLGDHLQNGETFAGLATNDLIASLAKYIYNDGEERVFEQNDNLSGGSKPTAVFSLFGKEGTNEPQALQTIEVQRIAPDKPVQITVLDTSVASGSNAPIVEWVYTIKDPDGTVIDTKVYIGQPTDTDILLEIGPDSPAGKYRIELVVKDEAGVYSDKVTRTFEAKKDEIPPAASLGPSGLPVNPAGEYERTPQTIELSDEGWGVIAYSVEYLQHGTDEPLSGVKTEGGVDYTAEEILLNDHTLALIVPNNVTGLPGKYDIKVTVYDWAGNKTEEVFTINTLKSDANKALLELGSFLTASDIKSKDPGLNNVLDLVLEAERIVSEYAAGGGSINELTNFSYIADVQNAIDAYYEAVAFTNAYGYISSISIGEPLDAEDIVNINAASDAYNNLSAGAKSILGDINTALVALETKIGHINNTAVVLSNLSECTNPDYINETTILEALQLLASAEEEIQAYINEHSDYTQADLENLPEYEIYLNAKEVIGAYQETQDYLLKYSILTSVTLNDIPNGLPGMSIEELINALEDALGFDYDSLSDIAKDNYVQEYKLYFDGLYNKATAYIIADDLINELNDIASEPYEILCAIINDPAGMQELFDRATSAIESYTGTPETDFSNYDVYGKYRDAFDKYEDYLEYINDYANVLSFAPGTVKISDIGLLENTIFAYENLQEPDVMNALMPQKNLLDTLLIEAQNLLAERNALKDDIESLIESIAVYQNVNSINNQNKDQIVNTLETIRQKIERFIELGSIEDDIDNYEEYQSVLDAMRLYIYSEQSFNNPRTRGGSQPINNDSGGSEPVNNGSGSTEQENNGSGGSEPEDSGSGGSVEGDNNSGGNVNTVLDNNNPVDDKKEQLEPNSFVPESKSETTADIEQNEQTNEMEITDNLNNTFEQAHNLPTKETAESLGKSTESNQNPLHTANMKEEEFALLFDETVYIIYDKNGNPLGYVVLLQGQTLEDINIEDSLIPFSTFTGYAVKENPITWDNTNIFYPAAFALLTFSLYIAYAVIKHTKNG